MLSFFLKMWYVNVKIMSEIDGLVQTDLTPVR